MVSVAQGCNQMNEWKGAGPVHFQALELAAVEEAHGPRVGGACYK